MPPLDILKKIYDQASFQHRGHQVIDLLTTYLKANDGDQDPTMMPYQSPEAMLDYWRSRASGEVIDLIRDFVARSIHLHHPHYMGHQVVPPAPDTALASLVGALLNNGGAVYEMGMASNALEKTVIEKFCTYFGYDPAKSGGVFTSGGTLANLTAMLCARAKKGDQDWTKGSQHQYGVLVSSEAHYCIDRAARIMGWGSEGIISVPVDDRYCMRVDLLGQYHMEAAAKGIELIAIVGSAPSTSTGNYDDLEAIGQFAEQKGLWFHIDAAHGGPAVFSDKYRHLMKGCESADSITVDGHKMMMMPGLTTKLFFKDNEDSFATFAQEAQYLWSSEQGDWYNAGKRTFECTKLIMSLRYQVLLEQYGMDGFSAFVEQCYDLGKMFKQVVDQHDLFELAVEPDSNIVCFRPKRSLDLATLSKVRMDLIRQGRFYIVQTSLRGEPCFRVSLMNPFTTREDMKELLETIGCEI